MDMIRDNKTRLIVNVNDLRRRNPNRAAMLVHNTLENRNRLEKVYNNYSCN